jgi:hypothetical protein
MIYDAYYYHDTKELCDYLRSPDLPLDEEKRRELADLIDRRIHRRKQGKGGKPGRKPGSIPAKPGVFTTNDAVAFARGRLKWIRARNGGRVPRGTLEKLIEEVCKDFGYEGYKVHVDLEKALRDLRRGRPAHRLRKS